MHSHLPQIVASIPHQRPAFSRHADRDRGFALLGLVIHGVADGLALGGLFIKLDPRVGVQMLSPLSFFCPDSSHKGKLLVKYMAYNISDTNFLYSAYNPCLHNFNHLNKRNPRSLKEISSLSTPLSALVTYVLCSFLGNDDKGNLAGLGFLYRCVLYLTPC